MPEPTPGPATPASTLAPGRPVQAVLFDLDGTLVDTNYLHVTAWWEAFLEAGHEVSAYDVHRAIGLPSTDLVQQLLGRPDDAVTAGHDERWEQVRPRALAFHGAGDLLRACAERGVKVIWATSGSSADIDAWRALLGADEAVHAVVGGDDVRNGKPHPEIVQKALAAAGVQPDRAVMVGDTTYDIRAAAAAGVRCIGLLAGGIGELELRQAGVDAVLGNAAELLDALDDALNGTLAARAA